MTGTGTWPRGGWVGGASDWQHFSLLLVPLSKVEQLLVGLESVWLAPSPQMCAIGTKHCAIIVHGSGCFLGPLSGGEMLHAVLFMCVCIKLSGFIHTLWS